MRLKKLLSLMLLLFATALQAVADTALVVEKHDGTKETFLLSEIPEIKTKGDTCVFITANATVEILRTDIDYIHFDNIVSAIHAPMGKSDITVKFLNNHTVQIAGVESQRIAVYDISGRAVNATVSTAADTTTVSLTALPRGAYIVKYGNNSIKILRK